MTSIRTRGGGYSHIEVTGVLVVPFLGVKNAVLVPLRVFNFKTSSVVPFVVPLRVKIMEEFYDSAFSNLQKGREYNRSDLIAYANYECDRLCFILIPLRGKINLGPRPQNKILVPFKGHFKKIRQAPRHFYMGVPPPGIRNVKFI